MAEAPNFVLFEHAVGYTLFKVKEFEDIGNVIPEVESALADPQRFSSIVQVHAFEPFRNTETALENCNCLAHADLVNFLEAQLPKKKKKVLLGMGDPKVASVVSEQIPGLRLVHTGIVPEVLRGIRMHFKHLAKTLPHKALDKAQLSLGHSYSRSKVKFDVHRVDNMVIQSIALLDQMDKDINLFGMRIREWYSYHFPELFKLVPEQYKYVKCATIIRDRADITEDKQTQLQELLGEEKTAEVVEAARTSMGMEIAELDLSNIESFGKRVASLSEYRARLHEYIKDRMSACAPSLSSLVGEQVGARLISRAGSLTNLAKYPASTVQILGAEKALFRALKTRTNTPKHGLLFHSAFIGKASIKNKGRISRFLANKCTIASRIDCFSEVPVATFGEFLKQQVEDRLTYFETGQIPKKNLEVMKEAAAEAEPVKAKILKKRKKAAKKAKKVLEESTNGHGDTNGTVEAMEVDDEEPKPKKNKKKKQAAEA